MDTNSTEQDEAAEVHLERLKPGEFGVSELTGNIYEVLGKSHYMVLARVNGEERRLPRTVAVIPITAEQAQSIAASRQAGVKRNPHRTGVKRMAKKTAARNGAGNLYAEREVIFSDENLKRFDEQVDKRGPAECWPWKGRRTGPSGAFFVNGKELRVGKYVYLRYHPDADPTGRYVQQCTPDCCNPAHVHPAGAVKKTSKKAAPAPPEAAIESKGKAKPAAKAASEKKPAKATRKAEPQQKDLDKKGSTRKGSKVDTTGLAFPKPGSTKKAKVSQQAPVAEKRVRAPKNRK
jgi:hypothetical protein